MSIMANAASVVSKHVTHWVAEAPPLPLSNVFLFWLCRGHPSSVLLPQLSKASLHLPRHVDMVTSQQAVLLLVSVKQYVITALQCFSARPLIISQHWKFCQPRPNRVKSAWTCVVWSRHKDLCALLRIKLKHTQFLVSELKHIQKASCGPLTCCTSEHVMVSCCRIHSFKWSTWAGSDKGHTWGVIFSEPLTLAFHH